ncbi:LOW QUALITY PROTEIN: hypothetical protein IFM47457_07679 [Aspergillus lentulus]|nr:LOW QUALITY PROTEIN: hypothetical protein IFM47457_07679 [Aspergillus lentulus]
MADGIAGLAGDIIRNTALLILCGLCGLRELRSRKLDNAVVAIALSKDFLYAMPDLTEPSCVGLAISTMKSTKIQVRFMITACSPGNAHVTDVLKRTSTTSTADFQMEGGYALPASGGGKDIRINHMTMCTGCPIRGAGHNWNKQPDGKFMCKNCHSWRKKHGDKADKAHWHDDGIVNALALVVLIRDLIGDGYTRRRGAGYVTSVHATAKRTLMTGETLIIQN